MGVGTSGAKIFNKESFNQRFDVQPSQIGLADVLKPCPKVQRVSSEPAVVEAPLQYVRKRIACISYHIQGDELRSRALNRFRALVSLDLHAAVIGESMLNYVGRLDTSTDVLQVRSDALSSRATGTLLKRSSSLWRWANWLATTDRGTCFNQAEDTVYQYMNHLRDSGAAPTAACHFVEALRFSNQDFRFKKMSLESILTSRVTGAAHSILLHERKLQQAPAFTVEAVGILEDLCNEDPQDQQGLKAHQFDQDWKTKARRQSRRAIECYGKKGEPNPLMKRLQNIGKTPKLRPRTRTAKTLTWMRLENHRVVWTMHWRVQEIQCLLTVTI